MQKRGALELSVNTIVVIVIGVTILVLGLTFVNRIFGGVDETGTSALDRIRAELDSIGSVNQLISLSPKNIEVEQSKSGSTRITIANLESQPYTAVVARVTSGNTGVRCSFADTGQTQTQSYDIPSGKQISVDLLVDASNTVSLGRALCNIDVQGTGIGDPDTSDSVFIDIVS